MAERLHIKLEGDIALLLVRIDPSYHQFLKYVGPKRIPTIYAELSKALYGTLQAALLFYNNLTSFLIKQGFKHNPYDGCVYNKVIAGKQCTIGWHVDDLKISHVSPQQLVDSIIQALNGEYGKEAPLTVTRGKVHNYLGMIIDYSVDGKVIIRMDKYVEEVIAETPEELLKLSATTPATNHLFEIDNNKANELSARGRLNNIPSPSGQVALSMQTCQA